jgi:DNA-binding LytR/AlgR family response regulator|uniref:Response regulator n=1 Tax=Siphoviridae sp. ctGQT3 TaxID=2825412 RepID=A0A8S5UE78_9CAUD|nr:MAG TPA: response regulator [Siphoviridae sp. ctGQT3]
MIIVVVEDNRILREREIKAIRKALKDYNYKIVEYSDFTKELKKLIQTPDFKIYVLDIELLNSSGIDIANFIRDYDDMSEIIMCSFHYELEYKVLKSKLKILDFVSKYDNAYVNLTNLILEVFNKHSRKILKITDKGVILFIVMKDILYISKEKNTRKCVIKTFNNEYLVNKNLEEIKQELNSDFIQVSRNCIVNQNNVEEYNFKDSKIKFKNGEEIDVVLKSFIEKIKF